MSIKLIKNNKILYIAGFCFMIYSIIEISDCIFILLIALNLAPNLYLNMISTNSEIFSLLQTNSIVFFPFFFSFTLMRITSTIGIFKNKIWGFYIGIISLILTMLLTILFIPMGFFEFFFCAVILILLIIGYFGNKPLINR